MKYDLATLVRDIRICIDQNVGSDEFDTLSGSDNPTLELNDIIKQKIEHALRFVYDLCPVDMLAESAVNGRHSDCSVDERGKITIEIPNINYIRLLTLKMGDWRHGVSQVISWMSEEYKMQSSHFKGVRGNPVRPVVCILPTIDGIKIEAWSTYQPQPEIEELLYVTLPKITDEQTIDIPSKLYLSVVYYAAGLTCMTLKDELANSLLEQAVAQISEASHNTKENEQQA